MIALLVVDAYLQKYKNNSYFLAGKS